MEIEITPFEKEKQYGQLIKKNVRQFLRYNSVNIEATVAFNFVSQNKIYKLNQKYRHLNKPTNVLSFPIWEKKFSIPKTGAVNLGDIFICEDFVENPEELESLIKHSLNHLIGKHH